MIHQIAPVANKTEPLPAINKALMQARHIQAQVKTGALPKQVHIWSPITSGPYMVPVTVTRWIE
jgi:hypothetical protein